MVSAPPVFQTGFPIRPGRLAEAVIPEDVREACALRPRGRRCRTPCRTAGFQEAETAKRPAGLVSQYDPAGLFGGPYGA